MTNRGTADVLLNDPEYLAVLARVKAEVVGARQRARMALNREVLLHYWEVGRLINEHSAWGGKFVENLARDILMEFPGATGYSVRSLKYMAKFASTYPDLSIVQQTAAQLPWGHTMLLLDRVKDGQERDCCSSLAPVSLSSADSTGWTWMGRTTRLTCCSTTSGCAATSS